MRILRVKESVRSKGQFLPRTSLDLSGPAEQFTKWKSRNGVWLLQQSLNLEKKYHSQFLSYVQLLLLELREFEHIYPLCLSSLCSLSSRESAIEELALDIKNNDCHSIGEWGEISGSNFSSDTSFCGIWSIVQPFLASVSSYGWLRLEWRPP